MRMIMAITTNVSLERTNMAVMTSRGLIITMIFLCMQNTVHETTEKNK